MARFNLVLSESELVMLRNRSLREGLNTSALIRKCIKLALLVLQLSEDPRVKLMIVTEDGTAHEWLIL